MARSGYTGKLAEEEILGHCRIKPVGLVYFTYGDSMAMARRAQPAGWDPTDPPTPGANDLHALVASELGVQDYSDLKLYSAIGTALDQFHSVDGWFEFRGEVVTIDVTMNPQKEGYKANVIVPFSAFTDRVELRAVARGIASRFPNYAGVSA